MQRIPVNSQLLSYTVEKVFISLLLFYVLYNVLNFTAGSPCPLKHWARCPWVALVSGLVQMPNASCNKCQSLESHYTARLLPQQTGQLKELVLSENNERRNPLKNKD